ncbi:hypothetical protein BGZ58_002151 [Dissophora ornata]|nr:hypothetical protein BGZ58_002151 [Dissophora ornata]
MSLTHSRHPEAAHMIRGEILISGQKSGYVQYTIVLDHEWMTRKVKMSSMIGSQEKRLVLEVDQDQRWYKVTEHRLARTRSFYRSGLSQSQVPGVESNSSSRDSISSGSKRAESQCSMQDADASLSDSSASCYSSSSDSECSIPFEKINLTWTPPPKGAKQFSFRNFLVRFNDILAHLNIDSDGLKSYRRIRTQKPKQSRLHIKFIRIQKVRTSATLGRLHTPRSRLRH